MDGERLRLGQWLRQRLFSVNERAYTLLDTLKHVANREAVHADVNRDVEARDMTRVHFGYTTYPHLIAIMVASYLLEQYGDSRRTRSEIWPTIRGVKESNFEGFGVIFGGELSGGINPMGFAGEYHETGISRPSSETGWKKGVSKDAVAIRA